LIRSILKALAKYYGQFYLYSIPFLIIVPTEISDHFFKIPEYASLTEFKGEVVYSRATSSRFGSSHGNRHQLIIKNDTNMIKLICHVKSKDSIYCPPYNNNKIEREFYKGKTVTVRWDKQEQSLYEIEIDGQKLVTYHIQRMKYEEQSADGEYLGILGSLIMLSLGFIGYKMKKQLLISESTSP